MATVWTTMEKTGDGRYVESGFHRTEPEKWYRVFTVTDPEEFIAHMRRFQSIPRKALSREAYVELCREFGVAPASEDDLELYGTTLRSSSTTSYLNHTEPENREFAIADAIHKLRYRSIRKERNV